MGEPYGYELLLDLHKCDPTKFTVEGIKAFCVELCDDVIKMERHDFHVWASDYERDWKKEKPEFYGVSAVQFISTSNLVIHALPKMLRVYLNVFSCRWFDPMETTKFCEEYFSGTNINSKFVERI